MSKGKKKRQDPGEKFLSILNALYLIISIIYMIHEMV